MTHIAGNPLIINQRTDNKTIILKKYPYVFFYSRFKFQMLDSPPCIYRAVPPLTYATSML